MLYVAAPDSRQETASHLRRLISSGAQAYGTTIRAMVRGKPRNEKELGEKIASIIETKQAVPANWQSRWRPRRKTGAAGTTDSTGEKTTTATSASPAPQAAW